MRTFTSKEIAARIARTDDESKPAFERVSHWTREGLLKPYGDEHPGTGRKREYAEEEMKKARLLNALADFGVGIKTMKRVVQEVYNNRLLKDIITQGRPCLITLQKSPEGVYQSYIKTAEETVEDGRKVIRIRLWESESDCVLVINLTRLMRV